MSSFEINKIIGSLLLVALTVVVIGMVRGGLTGGGGHDGDAAPAHVAKAKEPAGKRAPKKAATLAPVAPLLASASEAKGRKVFGKCAACHSGAEGGPNKIGPNLWNIVNAMPGKRPGFKYSKAMAGLKGKWSYEQLNGFLARPKKFLPGTRMGFAGIKKAGDRANLIRYLRTLSEFPVPLP